MRYLLSSRFFKISCKIACLKLHVAACDPVMLCNALKRTMSHSTLSRLLAIHMTRVLIEC